MKVYISGYPSWVGAYQIAEYFPYRLRRYIENCKLIDEICNYIYEKRKRRVWIKIDPSDTWSMDSTLSLIIVPMLKQLKDTSQSYGMIDEPDLPEGIEKESLEAWHWAIDRMIEAFSSDITEWEEQWESGEVDLVFENNTVVHGPKHTFKRDEEGIAKQRAKIERGRQLFAKYYDSLWD